MFLRNWINLGRKHWKEHLANMYRELKKAVMLEQALAEAAELTYQAAGRIEQQSVQPAWQQVREIYLLLPPEASQKTDESR
ncbi:MULTISPECIES: hypothetical protein [unclassified Sinorhizobium]|uniref:hypothetical protein n=1 Tax=unclassified Sinorhizobium TaxID=2613772 RepID=UPI0024C2D43A|nr:MULTISPECIES: hypothetical protein [unclassified Sinorhizobium]MDK1375827.1 hypothetical protein [Sinorhizobium sp. 6-70]MDK1481028.1 hypothetical protein [Sinorhizobium sp. 6-117]